MSMRSIFALLVAPALVFSLSACATGGEYSPVATASGRPEAYFSTIPDTTSSKIAAGCMNIRGTVHQSTPNMVVCEMPMGMGQQIVAQALMGNSYSTTPQEFIRFNIIPTAKGSRVQAQGWIETTMAFGQKQTTDISSGRAGSQIQQFLYGLGGSASE